MSWVMEEFKWRNIIIKAIDNQEPQEVLGIHQE